MNGSGMFMKRPSTPGWIASGCFAGVATYWLLSPLFYSPESRVVALCAELGLLALFWRMEFCRSYAYYKGKPGGESLTRIGWIFLGIGGILKRYAITGGSYVLFSWAAHAPDVALGILGIIGAVSVFLYAVCREPDADEATAWSRDPNFDTSLPPVDYSMMRIDPNPACLPPPGWLHSTEPPGIRERVIQCCFGVMFTAACLASLVGGEVILFLLTLPLAAMFCSNMYLVFKGYY